MTEFALNVDLLDTYWRGWRHLGTVYNPEVCNVLKRILVPPSQSRLLTWPVRVRECRGRLGGLPVMGYLGGLPRDVLGLSAIQKGLARFGELPFVWAYRGNSMLWQSRGLPLPSKSAFPITRQEITDMLLPSKKVVYYHPVKNIIYWRDANEVHQELSQ